MMNGSAPKKDKIKEYWDNRANQHGSSTTITTDDTYLRELEVSTIADTFHEILSEKGKVLDIGCGDGYSTIRLAELMSNIHFHGIDYSDNMIRSAMERLNSLPKLNDRVKFSLGDVCNLRKACGESIFDVVISDRCLINLESIESQADAIFEIADHLREGGYYVAIENFIEGHLNMNGARRSVGLPEIPIRWHNLYFAEGHFIESTTRFFEIVAFKDFSSSYYFATRVIYAKMCQMRGENPDYKHEIHQLAVLLPWVGQFSPIRMVVMRRKRKAGNMEKGRSCA